MSWGVFVFTGAVVILIVAELLEGIIPYGGIASALVVGVPLTVMRKPIFNTINAIVIVLMPEALTKEELRYIEAYSMVMDDGVVTKNERKLLVLQAKNLELDEERVEFLELWYMNSISKSSVASILLSIYSCTKSQSLLALSIYFLIFGVSTNSLV